MRLRIFFLPIELESGADSERRVLFYLEMLALTFPLGFFSGLLASFPVDLLNKVGVEMSASDTQIATDFLTWLSMVAIGFLQWFVWLPKLLAWIKSKVTNRAGTD